MKANLNEEEYKEFLKATLYPVLSDSIRDVKSLDD